MVTRLDETCREVMSAARLIGDPDLYQKMSKGRELIRRDIAFTARYVFSISDEPY